MTQSAFVRISANPKIVDEAVSIQDALATLAGFAGHKKHVFWHDDLSLLEDGFPADLLAGHRQVTDAYLLGLAVKHGGRLATLDRSLNALLTPKDKRRQNICLIPA